MHRGRKARVDPADIPVNAGFRPALTPEDRDNQVISAAYNLAERQLLDGTASAAVITHFLNLATKKTDLERRYLEEKTRLATSKAESIDRQMEQDELVTRAIEAMRRYAGHTDPVDMYEEDY